jgi:hypothetical protein
MTYRKVGGLHFLRLGPLGLVWFWSRRKARPKPIKVDWDSLPYPH